MERSRSPVTLELIEIARIENGKIAERWAQLNLLHMLQQLGVTHILQG